MTDERACASSRQSAFFALAPDSWSMITVLGIDKSNVSHLIVRYWLFTVDKLFRIEVAYTKRGQDAQPHKN